jgi:hypothetical protein
MVMKTSDQTLILFRLLFASLFISLSAGLFSQETGTCAEKLKSAQSYFEKGQVDSIPALLKDCLKSGFKREEELTAYKLIIQTFLLNDKIKQADSAMYEFLKKNPEYQLSPTDHSSFVYLFSTFKVKPVIKIGVHAGLNKPFLTFVEEVPVMGKPGSSTFTSKASKLFFSVDARFKITGKIELGVEFGYSQLSFTNEVQILGASGNEFSVTKYNETQRRIEIPLSMTYDVASLGKFTPYFRVGAGAAYNLGTNSEVTNTPTDRNNLSGSRTGEILNRKDSRIPVDLFGQIGIGMKYKIPRGMFFAELRSNTGILNQNISTGRTLPILVNYYFWSDPGFRINSLNLNVGFTYIFYKPSKRAE